MVQREEFDKPQGQELPAAQSFPELSAELKTAGSELIYGLYDRPPLVESIFVAIQHVLAAFVGIVTPPLIICTSLGIDPANTSFLISMSLFASGVCTFVQCKTFGPVGSGLLSLQGTSFAFLGAILGVGSTGTILEPWSHGAMNYKNLTGRTFSAIHLLQRSNKMV